MNPVDHTCRSGRRPPARSRARALLAAAPLLAIALAVPSSLLAQSGGGYEITRSTVDAGGGLSQGGIYELHGSIGQHDAAPPLAAGGYLLQPGFWAGGDVDQGTPLPPEIFSDGFESP